MDLRKMIAELHREMERVDQAIAALERLSLARGKRRGRPSKWAIQARALAAGVAPEKRRSSKVRKEA